MKRFSPASFPRQHILAGVLMLPLLWACTRHEDTTAVSSAPAAANPAPPAAGKTGEWMLVPGDSRVSFVSIKNNAIAEVHRFSELDGRVSEQGRVDVNIPLASVATGIPIRDQRMRDVLFQVTEFPKATVSLDIDAAKMRTLAVGGHIVLQASAMLTMHGLENPLLMEARITRTSATQWLVTSERPSIVETVNFGLINGVDELRKIAGLQAIGSAVPVTYSLTFSAAP